MNQSLLALGEAMAVTRKPLQQRSRERVKLIKDTSREIILEKGSAAFTMLEVAKRAEITVASIYQYFSNQTDLILALASEIYEESLDLLVPYNQESLASMSLEEVLDFLNTTFEQFCIVTAEDPVRVDILIAVESDKKLNEYNWEMTLRTSERFYSLFAPHLPKSEHDWLRRSIEYYVHGLHNTVRMLRLVEESERKEYIASIKYCMLAPFTLRLSELSN